MVCTPSNPTKVGRFVMADDYLLHPPTQNHAQFESSGGITCGLQKMSIFSLNVVRCSKTHTKHHVSMTSTVQLAEVSINIFNLSLRFLHVLKKTIIVPVPKIFAARCLNDNRPVALTSSVMKCFKRLVKTTSVLSFSPPWILSHLHSDG